MATTQHFEESLAPAKSTSSIVKKSMGKALKSVVREFFVPPKDMSGSAVAFQSYKM